MTKRSRAALGATPVDRRHYRRVKTGEAGGTLFACVTASMHDDL